jgi:sugar phosphate isomerase/epimerase
MLLTLSTGSLRNRISLNGESGMSLLDVPAFTIKELKLHGLNILASMLSKWGLEDLDRLRDRADKASCPCLVLIEDAPLPLASEDPAVRKNAGERVRRLAVAANRLGCNALAVHCQADDEDECFDVLVAELKGLMPAIERLELNILIAPTTGLTHTTDRLTSVIKRIGGFRIGSLPSFAAAAATGEGDPIEALRKLAPYAGAIQASVEGFNKKGAHKSYDLAKCVTAVRSVGFLNTLAIDYTGAGDPVPSIEMARDILQQAIDIEEA